MKFIPAIALIAFGLFNLTATVFSLRRELPIRRRCRRKVTAECISLHPIEDVADDRYIMAGALFLFELGGEEQIVEVSSEMALEAPKCMVGDSVVLYCDEACPTVFRFRSIGALIRSTLLMAIIGVAILVLGVLIAVSQIAKQNGIVF